MVTIRERPGEHLVHFFSTESDFLAVATGLVAEAHDGGERAVIVGRRAHLPPLLSQLRAQGIDADSMVADGRCLIAGAEAMLERFMVDDQPQAEAFNAVVGALLGQASPPNGRIRVLGEMVGALWETGNCVAALELERLWNDVRQQLPFDLLCCYPVQAQDVAASLPVLVDVCESHDAVSGIAPSEERADETLRFSRMPESAKAARTFVRDTFAAWGYGGRSVDGELVVSELAANAMTHGRSDFTVSLTRTGTGVRIAVGDAASGAPAHRRAHPEAISGRGLGLVDARADDWGHVPRPVGKVVWAHVVMA